MHFDPRTQQAFRDAGLTTEEIEAASEDVVSAVRATADELESFFEDRGTVYSDMDRAHSDTDVQNHAVEYCDLYTHADDRERL